MLARPAALTWTKTLLARHGREAWRQLDEDLRRHWLVSGAWIVATC